MAPAPDLDLFQGTLDVLVLKTLSWGPRHGYAVARCIRGDHRRRLQVEDRALYVALHRLERARLGGERVGTHREQPQAKYYQLTAAGRGAPRGDRALDALREGGVPGAHATASRPEAPCSHPGLRRVFRLDAPPASPARSTPSSRSTSRCGARELAARGLAPTASAAEAPRRFGDVTRARGAAARSTRGATARARPAERLHGLAQDLRSPCARSGARRGFHAVVVLTLAFHGQRRTR